MGLDPQAKALIDELNAAEGPDLTELPPAEARAMYLAMKDALDVPDVAIGKIEDRTIEGPGGEIAIRIYTPVAAGGEALPGVVYYHGGGWVIGDLETHDPLCRTLANESGARVISVDYRLAPEHVFPAAVDDAWAALKWVERNAASIGVDANRLAVAGDSAGGNLAAVMAQKAKAEGGPKLALQLLIYPVTDAEADTESKRDLAEGYFLEKKTMDWFFDHYAPERSDRGDPRLSPAQAKSLNGLAPAHIITAGFDVLRDEGKLYAEALEGAGVPVTYKNYDGMIHGFFTMQGALDVSRQGLKDAGAALQEAFAA